MSPQGMKEFKCDVCAREFTLSANLKRHMLIHASVRPFQCHVCFKTFVQKQTLKTHMIVHLPVKPFKCKVSEAKFLRQDKLVPAVMDSDYGALLCVRCAGSRSTECTISSATCTSMPAASPSSALTAPASST